MGVYDDSLCKVERIAKDNIGGFAADPSKKVQLAHGPRDFALVI
jgi:hypothetical protein